MDNRNISSVDFDLDQASGSITINASEVEMGSWSSSGDARRLKVTAEPPERLESKPSEKWPFLQVRSDGVHFFETGSAVVEVHPEGLEALGEVQLVAHGNHPRKVSGTTAKCFRQGIPLGRCEIEEIPQVIDLLGGHINSGQNEADKNND
jgi:hypothetical protein